MRRRSFLSGLLAALFAGSSTPVIGEWETDPDNPPGPDWYWCDKCQRWHQKSIFRDSNEYIYSNSDSYLDMHDSTNITFDAFQGGWAQEPGSNFRLDR